MNSYMEKRLLDLHKNTKRENILTRLLASFIGYSTAIFIPFAHLGLLYSFWARNKPAVDRHSCTCSCFDTIFRGKYEWSPSTYKHIYFNTTIETFKIFVILVFGVIICYETVKNLVNLISLKVARISFIVVLASSIYPHYYGLWNFFQYINEEFFFQWYHQSFFSITELLSSSIILNLCDGRRSIKTWKLLVVLCVSVVHLFVSFKDQFMRNVIKMEGKDFEIMRDLGLTLGDVTHVAITVWHLRKSRVLKEELLIFLLAVALMSTLACSL